MQQAQTESTSHTKLSLDLLDAGLGGVEAECAQDGSNLAAGHKPVALLVKQRKGLALLCTAQHSTAQHSTV